MAELFRITTQIQEYTVIFVVADGLVCCQHNWQIGERISMKLSGIIRNDTINSFKKHEWCEPHSGSKSFLATLVGLFHT